MRRVLAQTLTASLLVLVFEAGLRPAVAHGLGESYNVPLPLWLYIYGVRAMVLITFIPISLFAGRAGGGREPLVYPRFDLLRIGVVRSVLTGRAFLLKCRSLSVTLFVPVILGGFLGLQIPDHNLAPTFVWITWWVGLSFFTAFVGNVWPLLSPWKIIFEWAERLARYLGVRNGLEFDRTYTQIVPTLALVTVK